MYVCMYVLFATFLISILLLLNRLDQLVSGTFDSVPGIMHNNNIVLYYRHHIVRWHAIEQFTYYTNSGTSVERKENLKSPASLMRIKSNGTMNRRTDRQTVKYTDKPQVSTVKPAR